MRRRGAIADVRTYGEHTDGPVVALAALLVETASRELSGLEGAFVLSAAEWTIICFGAGIVVSIAGAIVATLKGEPDAKP